MKRPARPEKLTHVGDVDGQLLGLIHQRPKLLILCTPGGSIEVALACVDALEAFPVDICATGQCMSAGLVVLAAGRRRVCTPRTRFMLHPGTAEFANNPDLDTVRAEADEFQHLEETYAAILGQRTRLGADEWLAMGRATRYFGAKQALAWGLVDAILTPTS